MSNIVAISDEQLLNWCRIPRDASPDVVEYLRATATLLAERSYWNHAHAVVTLATAMGRSSTWAQNGARNLDEPQFEEEGWIEQQELARIITQIGGLLVGRAFHSDTANVAIIKAKHEHWLRESELDAWHPGMTSGSGIRRIVQAQPVGIARAWEEYQSIVAKSQPQTPDNSSTIDKPQADQPIKESADCVSNVEAPEEPSPANDQSPGDTEPQRPLDKTWLATIVCCIYSLRDLRLANQLYPNAIAKKDYDSLESQLRRWIDQGLEQPGFERFNDPELKNDEPYPLALVTALMMNAPGVDVADPESFPKIMGEFQQIVLPDAEKITQRVMELRIWNCFVPNPEGDDNYRDPRRYLQLIDVYWQLFKPLLFNAMDHMVHFNPHPLTRWVMNLQKRVQICFAGVANIVNSNEAKTDFDELVSLFLGDPDELDIAKEQAIAQLRSFDMFLAATSLDVGIGGFDLTREENDFVRVMKKLADDHIAEMNRRNRRFTEYLNSPKDQGQGANPDASVKDQATAPSSVAATKNEAGTKQKGGAVRARVSQQKVDTALAFIREKPNSKAVTIASHIGVEEPTFRSNYVPVLKDRGVKNDGEGYYLPEG